MESTKDLASETKLKPNNRRTNIPALRPIISGKEHKIISRTIQVRLWYQRYIEFNYDETWYLIKKIQPEFKRKIYLFEQMIDRIWCEGEEEFIENQMSSRSVEVVDCVWMWKVRWDIFPLQAIILPRHLTGRGYYIRIFICILQLFFVLF